MTMTTTMTNHRHGHHHSESFHLITSSSFGKPKGLDLGSSRFARRYLGNVSSPEFSSNEIECFSNIVFEIYSS